MSCLWHSTIDKNHSVTIESSSNSSALHTWYQQEQLCCQGRPVDLTYATTHCRQRRGASPKCAAAERAHEGLLQRLLLVQWPLRRRQQLRDPGLQAGTPSLCGA